MRLRTLATLTSLVLVVTPLAAAPDNSADAKKAIVAAYQKMDAAIAKKDAKTVLAYHMTDYYSTDAKGKKTTYAQLEQMAPMLFSMMRSAKQKTTVAKVTSKGDQAVARVSIHAEIVLPDPQDAQKTAKLVADETSDETWVKKGGEWKLSRSKRIKSRQTVNGKVQPQ
jgi:ketosteroid isomerase-like protein